MPWEEIITTIHFKKSKIVTTKAIADFTDDFGRITAAIYDLPTLTEGSAMQMVEQRQKAIVKAKEVCGLLIRDLRMKDPSLQFLNTRVCDHLNSFASKS